MTVWETLVGQDEVVAGLRKATSAADAALAGARTAGMTHAWLFTGPPGSGRSNAARAFAAALVCPDSGCGRCLACRTALAGSHADVRTLVTEQAVIRVDPVRDLVRLAQMAPVGGRWQVIIVEGADRLTDRAADALLKSIEEPPPRTVWLLCAPTVEDVVPTIRSRCRSIVLRTPSTEAVARYLVQREQVSEPVAAFAARASQGHIGRARALALDESARRRRREVLQIPAVLSDLGSCMTCAANLVDAATEEAQPRVDAANRRELDDLELAYGGGSRMARTSGFAAAQKELERNQRLRAKRLVRDAIDRSLLDLASFYRDVLTLQLGAVDAPLVNEELRPEVATAARTSAAELTARRLAAIFETRELLTGEIAPILAVESLMISLHGAVTATAFTGPSTAAAVTGAAMAGGHR